MNVKTKLFPMLSAVLGVAAAILRGLLYARAVDEKGLLVSGHPLTYAVWALAAAAAVLALLSMPGAKAWDDRPSPVLAGADLLLAVAIAAALLFRQGGDTAVLSIARLILGGAAVVGMAVSGILRIRGRKPDFLCAVSVCLFFLVSTLVQYPQWSRQTQIMGYAFSLGMYLSLSLFAYYQAALARKLPAAKQRRFVGMLAVFFCAASDAFLPLRLAAGLWTLLLLVTEQKEGTP